MLKRCVWSLALLVVVTAAHAVPRGKGTDKKAFDWPQWQGPERNALSRETGLLETWPKDGPPLAWKVKDLGGGYSTPSIAEGRIYGMSFRGKDEVVWALDETNGRELWSKRIAVAVAPRAGPGKEGSRCTPTVDGDRLYALGVNGDLVCLKVADGKEVWHKNLVKDFGGAIPSWGYSESPLVDGNKLIVTPGRKQATLAALNKLTGETIWTSQVPQGDGAAYSSVVAFEALGRREYVQFMSGGVVGISAEDGKFLWRYNKPSAGINCSTPVCWGDCVFAAASYGRGGGLVKLSRDGDKVKADEVYFTKHMKNHHGGMVLVNGYLYGSNEGLLACLEYKTGKVMWEHRNPGKGSILYADGRLYYRNEGGPIFLVEANPKKYVEQGRFNQPERSRSPAWSHPIIANGKLYIRDQSVLFCYDVKKK
jgi:outer membrane protein assembly factor BamB